jgi:hypothetical protein
MRMGDGCPIRTLGVAIGRGVEAFGVLYIEGEGMTGSQ